MPHAGPELGDWVTSAGGFPMQWGVENRKVLNTKIRLLNTSFS